MKESIKRPCLVSGTDLAWVVTSQKPNTLQTMRFGFTSHRSDRRIDLLNLKTNSTRMEDDDENDDDSEYDRLMDIFIRPDFSEPIGVNRCVVLVDAFVVTTNNIIPQNYTSKNAPVKHCITAF